MLEVGTKAPDFELPDQNGDMHKLSDYRGKKVILYFYPKDNTSGCTKQACGFSERVPLFTEKGAVIIGISKDTVASHKRFEEKQNLGITILADPERTVIEAYDVWKEKKNYGKVSMGVVRTTYLIDEEGTIIKANDKVKAADDPENMLQALSEQGEDMKIILSPAKKMNCDTDTLDALGLPEFLQETEEILTWLKAKSESELKALWKCNDKILEENMERLERLKSQQDLRKNLTPAVIAYDGIAYQYMAPAVFENEQLNYVQEHLRILSAFYGVLKAMDGVVPYRLEMQAKVDVAEGRNLYEFWGDKIYKAVRDESGIIINLASKEYFKCVEKYLRPEDRFITITFVEMAKDKDGKDTGKLVTKGTYAKMARGEMVRFMADGIEVKDGKVDLKVSQWERH